jgi:hypothetical protein
MSQAPKDTRSVAQKSHRPYSAWQDGIDFYGYLTGIGW